MHRRNDSKLNGFFELKSSILLLLLLLPLRMNRAVEVEEVALDGVDLEQFYQKKQKCIACEATNNLLESYCGCCKALLRPTDTLLWEHFSEVLPVEGLKECLSNAFFDENSLKSIDYNGYNLLAMPINSVVEKASTSSKKVVVNQIKILIYNLDTATSTTIDIPWEDEDEKGEIFKISIKFISRHALSISYEIVKNFPESGTRDCVRVITLNLLDESTTDHTSIIAPILPGKKKKQRIQLGSEITKLNDHSIAIYRNQGQGENHTDLFTTFNFQKKEKEETIASTAIFSQTYNMGEKQYVGNEKVVFKGNRTPRSGELLSGTQYFFALVDLKKHYHTYGGVQTSDEANSSDYKTVQGHFLPLSAQRIGFLKSNKEDQGILEVRKMSETFQCKARVALYDKEKYDEKNKFFVLNKQDLFVVYNGEGYRNRCEILSLPGEINELDTNDLLKATVKKTYWLTEEEEGYQIEKVLPVRSELLLLGYQGEEQEEESSEEEEEEEERTYKVFKFPLPFASKFSKKKKVRNLHWSSFGDSDSDRESTTSNRPMDLSDSDSDDDENYFLDEEVETKVPNIGAYFKKLLEMGKKVRLPTNSGARNLSSASISIGDELYWFGGGCAALTLLFATASMLEFSSFHFQKSAMKKAKELLLYFRPAQAGAPSTIFMKEQELYNICKKHFPNEKRAVWKALKEELIPANGWYKDHLVDEGKEVAGYWVYR